MRMIIKSFERYEAKFLVTDKQAYQLLNRIKEYVIKDEYCRTADYYTIANIYYDNLTHDIIRHSTSKPFFKEKFRVRIYGRTINDETLAYVELKKKYKGKVTKRRISLPLSNLNKFFSDQSEILNTDYLDRQIANELQFFIKTNNLVPSYFIKYDRFAYFAKENHDLRLTFDFNIIARTDKLDFNNLDDGQKLLPENIYILEIKNNGAIPLWLVNILSELKIYKTSFSKVGRLYEQNSKELIDYVQNLSDVAI